MKITREELLRRSTRNMQGVENRIAEWGQRIISQVYDEGIFAQVTGGYRSHEQQAYLYGQGRPGYQFNGTKYGRRGKVVTNAKPGQSIHNYGFAIDFCLVTDNGQQAVWKVNEDWRRVASVAKGLGFTWGGNWNSFQDYPHLEWTHGMSWEELKTGKSPFDYPGFLLRRGSRGKRVKQVQVAVQIRTDGIFGPKTEEVIRHFQRKHCLQVDGIVGPETWVNFYR
ncbi:M15 family metallopeptidase [Salimicrobium halophilum]|uniref:Peptidoglycan L-alanyl-D-glutamate endopeptidase CwlK n=1 Tax=Salimicrobium halophilum TaxID=86666 RepID=A0A1G8S2X9_9BACI|nr:M15 family metallopeptidase [Salimicrobium halophilum]SDJ23567.1 peptidoglycan L-alanyl-D-glutamate endopeptidase CwlK [Salimicrobium halophilum]